MKIKKTIRKFVPFAAPMEDISRNMAATIPVVRREVILQAQFAAAATAGFMSLAAQDAAGFAGVLAVNILFFIIELYFLYIGFRQNRNGVLARSSAAFATAAGLAAWISASLLITGS